MGGQANAIHPPISSLLELHPDSDTSILHIGVTFTMAMRWRMTVASVKNLAIWLLACNTLPYAENQGKYGARHWSGETTGARV